MYKTRKTSTIQRCCENNINVANKLVISHMPRKLQRHIAWKYSNANIAKNRVVLARENFREAIKIYQIVTSIAWFQFQEYYELKVTQKTFILWYQTTMWKTSAPGSKGNAYS